MVNDHCKDTLPLQGLGVYKKLIALYKKIIKIYCSEKKTDLPLHRQNTKR